MRHAARARRQHVSCEVARLAAWPARRAGVQNSARSAARSQPTPWHRPAAPRLGRGQAPRAQRPRAADTMPARSSLAQLPTERTSPSRRPDRPGGPAATGGPTVPSGDGRAHAATPDPRHPWLHTTPDSDTPSSRPSNATVAFAHSRHASRRPRTPVSVTSAGTRAALQRAPSKHGRSRGARRSVRERSLPDSGETTRAGRRRSERSVPLDG